MPKGENAQGTGSPKQEVGGASVISLHLSFHRGEDRGPEGNIRPLHTELVVSLQTAQLTPQPCTGAQTHA